MKQRPQGKALSPVLLKPEINPAAFSTRGKDIRGHATHMNGGEVTDKKVVEVHYLPLAVIETIWIMAKDF